MATEIDINAITDLLGRDRDQEINGLHHKAVGLAAEESGLEVDEVNRLAGSPQVREVLTELRDLYNPAMGTPYEWEGNPAERERIENDYFTRFNPLENRLNQAATAITGDPDAGDKLRNFSDEVIPLLEQADDREVRETLHLNSALISGDNQALGRLRYDQRPSAEMVAESEEHLAVAKWALAQRPDADGVLAIVQDLSAHPHSREWSGLDDPTAHPWKGEQRGKEDLNTPIYRELGSALNDTNLGDKDRLVSLQLRNLNERYGYHRLPGSSTLEMLPLEAPPAPEATKGPGVSAGQDMSLSFETAGLGDRGALSQLLADNFPDGGVVGESRQHVLGEPRLGEDGPWREPLDAAVNELSRDGGGVDWGWGSLKVSYVLATTNQGWVSFEGGQDGYAAYGKQHNQPNYSRLDSPAEVAGALGVSQERAGRMVETIRPAVQESYGIYVKQGDGPVLTEPQLGVMAMQVSAERVVGREMRTSIAGRDVPRVGSAPAASVPSPGGAPRVGGHAQAQHGHSQRPSMDR